MLAAVLKLALESLRTQGLGLGLCLLSKRLCAERSLLAAGAGWGEDTKINEECTAVELGVDGLDEPWLRAAGWSLDGLDGDEAGDDLWRTWGKGGPPADEDGVAVVPGVEDTEKCK